MTENTLTASGGPSNAELTLLSRVSSGNVLANHAVAKSVDGGRSFLPIRLLPELVGATCAGAIGPAQGSPSASLIAIPSSLDPNEIGGRVNMTVFKWDQGKAVLQCVVWGRAAGYSALDVDGKAMLFEQGNHIYDYGISYAPLAECKAT